ncbi:hypothetical protein BpHYR1_027095 [Brachionus plicatilis]|uniref:Uncharacterized protein n=1 Tax=Brachionus plicatilis TaxID=10195 RepID=A0A3M7SM62_BRAPC|nr:hypothetical protein BpHYR1_027095 [Brachionus plicatilis]
MDHSNIFYKKNIRCPSSHRIHRLLNSQIQHSQLPNQSLHFHNQSLLKHLNLNHLFWLAVPEHNLLILSDRKGFKKPPPGVYGFKKPLGVLVLKVYKLKSIPTPNLNLRSFKRLVTHVYKVEISGKQDNKRNKSLLDSRFFLIFWIKSNQFWFQNFLVRFLTLNCEQRFHLIFLYFLISLTMFGVRLVFSSIEIVTRNICFNREMVICHFLPRCMSLITEKSNLLGATPPQYLLCGLSERSIFVPLSKTNTKSFVSLER